MLSVAFLYITPRAQLWRPRQRECLLSSRSVTHQGIVVKELAVCYIEHGKEIAGLNLLQKISFYQKQILCKIKWKNIVWQVLGDISYKSARKKMTVVTILGWGGANPPKTKTVFIAFKSGQSLSSFSELKGLRRREVVHDCMKQAFFVIFQLIDDYKREGYMTFERVIFRCLKSSSQLEFLKIAVTQDELRRCSCSAPHVAS